MMPVSVVFTPQPLDVDSVSVAAATTGAVVIGGTLAAGGVATFSAPARVTIASAGNLSALTFTVAGTDGNGNEISESLAGPNNNTVTTSRAYNTVTAVTSSGTTGATTLTVGNSAVAVSPPFVLSRWGAGPADTTIGASLSAGGAITWGWEMTLGDPLYHGENGVTWYPMTVFAGKSATFHAPLPMACQAVRLVTSAITGGSLTIEILQFGIN